MSEELKSCPFCGSEAVIYVDHVLGPNEPLFSPMCKHLAYWYEHRFDGPTIRAKCAGSAGAAFPTWAEAIEVWNRRAPVPAPTVSSDVSDIIAIMADDWLERYSAGDSQWADAQVVRDWLDSLKGK